MNQNILNELNQLVDHCEYKFRKEACFALSNILTGNFKIIKFVLDHKIFNKILRIALTDNLTVFEIKKY